MLLPGGDTDLVLLSPTSVSRHKAARVDVPDDSASRSESGETCRVLVQSPGEVRDTARVHQPPGPHIDQLEGVGVGVPPEPPPLETTGVLPGPHDGVGGGAAPRHRPPVQLVEQQELAVLQLPLLVPALTHSARPGAVDVAHLLLLQTAVPIGHHLVEHRHEVVDPAVLIGGVLPHVPGGGVVALGNCQGL